MSLGSRIKEARAAKRLKQADVAARFGIKAAAVSQWETDETRPDTAKMRELAGLLGVTVDWLTQDDVQSPDLPSNVAGYGEAPATGSWPRDLPVYGSAVGSPEQHGHEVGAFEFNIGDIVDHIRRPPRLIGVKNAFAVFVVGESMMPRYRPGAPVIIHPGVQPAIDDDVLVELHPARDGDPHPAVLKRLVARTPTQLRLRQFNPSEDRITIQLKRVLRVYRVVPYEELFGF